jgi:hypothetical protein
MIMKQGIVLIATVVALTGCMKSAPKYWQHKTIPSEQWSSDHSRCKRAVDKHLGLYSTYEADQNLDQYSEQMRRYEVGKKQKKLVADCMRKLGYVPVR